MSPARRRKLIPVLLLFVLLGAGGKWYEWRQFSGADRGFRAVTGRDLPASVVAMAHASAVNDNFFHESHWWLLQGPAESLRELTPSPAFERSDQDAAQLTGQSHRLLAFPEARLLEGYEGSFDNGRDRWLLIFEPGDRAVFIY